jgi:hypothetical protein
MEIRIDGEGVARNPRRRDEAVGQRERIGGAILHAQAFR